MFSPQMSEAFVRRVVRYWTALEYFCGFIGVCSASGRKMYPFGPVISANFAAVRYTMISASRARSGRVCPARLNQPLGYGVRSPDRVLFGSFSGFGVVRFRSL